MAYMDHATVTTTQLQQSIHSKRRRLKRMPRRGTENYQRVLEVLSDIARLEFWLRCKTNL